MPRSHPPALLAIASSTIRAQSPLAGSSEAGPLFTRGDCVLVAVSGGPDSMALLHVLARLRDDLGHRLIAHGVDHGLRAEAAAELDGAEGLARKLAVPFARTLVALERGGNLQARARDARYRALRAAASREAARVIATAHHREDRAETVLLRLLRGAGPRGLAVLPPRAGDLVRPFIRAPRSAIEAHLARHSIPSARDPSNEDPRFLRARVRLELIPLLRALSPGIDEHLCALADQLNAPPADRRSPLSLPDSLPPTHGIARAARHAMDALLQTRSARARIALKGGLVARWDPVSHSLAVERSPGPPKRREGRREERANRPSNGQIKPNADK